MINILVVDDEPLILDEIARKVLSFSANIQVFPCLSPAEALAIAKSQPIDIALLDIQLPEMSGLDLAVRLQELRPDLTVVFITAYNHFATEAFEIEAQDYLLKPVRDERLFKTLKKLIDQPQLTSVKQPSIKDIEIKAFGEFGVFVDLRQIVWQRKKAGELFAFLLTNPKYTASKYQICDALWPDHDYEKSLVHLQTIVYQLRNALQGVERSQINLEYFDNRYKLSLNNCHYDVEQFEKATGSTQMIERLDYESLKELLELFGDGFLTREDWPWSMNHQNRLETKLCRILTRLEYLAKSNGNFREQQLFSAKLQSLLSDS